MILKIVAQWCFADFEYYAKSLKTIFLKLPFSNDVRIIFFCKNTTPFTTLGYESQHSSNTFTPGVHWKDLHTLTLLKYLWGFRFHQALKGYRISSRYLAKGFFQQKPEFSENDSVYSLIDSGGCHQTMVLAMSSSGS